MVKKNNKTKNNGLDGKIVSIVNKVELAIILIKWKGKVHWIAI